MRSYQQFFAELKRRQVFKVAGVYGVVAFGLIQVADPLAKALLLPDAFLTYVVAVLLLGFPLALVLAWAFEVTPQGVRKTEAATPEEIEAIVAQPASKRWPAGLLALVGVGALVAGAWWVGRRSGGDDGAAAGTRSADVRLAMTDQVDDNRPSIAVLPLVNMSADPNQEYFSDGITEEILNVLARLPELRVTERTSTFAFKGESIDLRAVGDSLGVRYLVEGSVRKDGDKLRITAQLIDASDGSHMWSESYDRTLDNVFQIQSEIAESIAEELRVPLGIEDPSSLVTPTADIEAYDLYLAARGQTRKRGESLREAIRLFRAAIARDSTWAPAWAGLAEAYELIGWYPEAWDEVPVDSVTFVAGRDTLWAAAERTVRRALELDPDNASANVALGSVLRNAWRWEGAEEAYLKALSVDPENPEAHQQYAEMLNDVGRIAEGRRAAERAVGLDRVAIRVYWLGNSLLKDDYPEPALEVFEKGHREFPESGSLRDGLARSLAVQGRFDEWAAVVAEDTAGMQVRQFAEGHLSRVSELAPGKIEAMVLLGQADSAAALLARSLPFRSPAAMWEPVLAPLLDHPKVLEVRRRMNLEDATAIRTPR